MSKRAPKVFVVNEPLRKNEETGKYARFLNLKLAAEHGEVVRLTPDGSPPANLEPWLRMIDEGLSSWRDGDFVVLVGDQSLLAYASAVVGTMIEFRTAATEGEVPGGTFRALKWSRHGSRYEPVELGFSVATPARESLTKSTLRSETK